MILRKNKESYLLKLNKTKQFYCSCGSKEYICMNRNGASYTCKKCKKESMIINLNSLKKLAVNTYEMNRIVDVQKDKDVLYFEIQNDVLKVSTKKVKKKHNTTILKINSVNLSKILFKYKDYLYKENLKMIIKEYNKIVPLEKRLIIYDYEKLSLDELYFLIFLLHKYPVLSNIQEYFKCDILLNFAGYDKKYNYNPSMVNILYKNRHKTYGFHVDKKKVHQILGLSKEVTAYLKELKMLKKRNTRLVPHLTVYQDMYQTLGKHTKFYLDNVETGVNFYNFKLILSHDTLNYSIPSLMNYVIKVTFFQNHPTDKSYMNYMDETLTILKDYLIMTKSLDIEPEMFPKELYNEHDRLSHLYSWKMKENMFRSEEKKFDNVMKNYKFEYQNEEYSIYKPKEIKDIYIEGKVLNHCVFTYTNRLLKGETQIYFLRKNDEIDKPLVTIEYNEEDNCVIQAKGNHNRSVNAKERLFINEWKQQFGIKQ